MLHTITIFPSSHLCIDTLVQMTRYSELSNAELEQLVRQYEAKLLRRSRPLQMLFTCGSACTGLGTEAIALHDEGIPARHVFGCDNLNASKIFCDVTPH